MDPQPRDWHGLQNLCRTLRGLEGCPWDRAQTWSTLTPYLLEETHELLEAIASGSDARTAEEMGDLLFLLAFVLTIAEEEGRFALEDVVGGVIAKMVRRHPHVFGSGAAGAEAIPQQWERIKLEESAGRPGTLATGARGLPALTEAYRIQEKAAAFGFDWPDRQGVLEKLQEEQEELRAALQSDSAAAAQEELGDVLFSAVNLARHLHADPELLLRAAVRKFQTRFSRMADLLTDEGRELGQADLATMEEAWQRAKRQER